MAKEAESVYRRIEAQMDDAGGLANLLRLHIFQHDKRQFPALETVRLQLEGATPAPSSGIEVRSEDDPPRWVEIDGIGLNPTGLARYGERGMVAPGAAGASASHYSQAVSAGPYLFFAGMIPIDPATRRVIKGFEDVEEEGRWLKRGRSHPDSRTGPIAAQTWSLYRRILAALAEQGGGPENICSATVFLSRAGDTADFLRVHRHFFPEAGPSLQIACVDEVGHEGTLIEIECTAHLGERRNRFSHGGEGRESPDVVRAGELGFVGDCLGLGENGLPALEKDEIADLALRDWIGARAAGDRARERLLTQGELAFDRLASSLATAGIGAESVGHLWIRARRGADRGCIEDLISRRPELNGAAITVNTATALPHSERAEITISAVCAGLGDDDDE
jgi:2-iminobutanoate/2-iminopropanoate deaminase